MLWLGACCIMLAVWVGPVMGQRAAEAAGAAACQMRRDPSKAAAMSDERLLRAAHRQLYAAMRAGDVKALDALLADDSALTHLSGYRQPPSRPCTSSTRCAKPVLTPGLHVGESLGVSNG